MIEKRTPKPTSSKLHFCHTKVNGAPYDQSYHQLAKHKREVDRNRKGNKQAAQEKSQEKKRKTGQTTIRQIFVAQTQLVVNEPEEDQMYTDNQGHDDQESDGRRSTHCVPDSRGCTNSTSSGQRTGEERKGVVLQRILRKRKNGTRMKSQNSLICGSRIKSCLRWSLTLLKIVILFWVDLLIFGLKWSLDPIQQYPKVLFHLKKWKVENSKRHLPKHISQYTHWQLAFRPSLKRLFRLSGPPSDFSFFLRLVVARSNISGNFHASNTLSSR